MTLRARSWFLASVCVSLTTVPAIAGVVAAAAPIVLAENDKPGPIGSLMDWWNTPRFSVEVPRALLPPVQDTDCESTPNLDIEQIKFRTKVWTYEKSGTPRTMVQLRSGCEPVKGYNALYRKYVAVWKAARRDLGDDGRITTDIEPQEDGHPPYFVVRWQNKARTDVYEAWRLKCKKGKTFIGGFRVVTPVQETPLTDENYPHMLNSFLAGDNCTNEH